jgi:hypothetical protein
MVECPMPTGKPIGPDPIGFFNFELDNLFGFLEATVHCRITLYTPVLPFKTMNNKILFTTGTFKGYFFSEELKLTKKKGYIIEAHNFIKFKINSE